MILSPERTETTVDTIDSRLAEWISIVEPFEAFITLEFSSPNIYGWRRLGNFTQRCEEKDARTQIAASMMVDVRQLQGNPEYPYRARSTVLQAVLRGQNKVDRLIWGKYRNREDHSLNDEGLTLEKMSTDPLTGLPYRVVIKRIDTEDGYLYIAEKIDRDQNIILQHSIIEADGMTSFGLDYRGINNKGVLSIPKSLRYPMGAVEVFNQLAKAI